MHYSTSADQDQSSGLDLESKTHSPVAQTRSRSKTRSRLKLTTKKILARSITRVNHWNDTESLDLDLHLFCFVSFFAALLSSTLKREKGKKDPKLSRPNLDLDLDSRYRFRFTRSF